MVAGVLLNYAANWSPGGGELHPDFILTSPDGPLTIDEVDTEIAKTEARLAELHRKRDWVSRAKNHKVELGAHEMDSWPIDFAVQAASLPASPASASATVTTSSPPPMPPVPVPVPVPTVTFASAATIVGGAATDMPGQPRLASASASKLDLGRVWRGPSEAPDGAGPAERCHRGKPDEPGTCELLFPWPDVPATKTAAALPRFPSTCFRQFHDRTGSVITEAPAASPQLSQGP